ncbi:hypothetical protein B0H11DRAFT_2218434 [Mycena galericulata]|nr:hypothetical protein B0H11DRAFT_2218434 [Mycena galericulata]
MGGNARGTNSSSKSSSGSKASASAPAGAVGTVAAAATATAATHRPPLPPLSMSAVLRVRGSPASASGHRLHGERARERDDGVVVVIAIAAGTGWDGSTWGYSEREKEREYAASPLQIPMGAAPALAPLQTYNNSNAQVSPPPTSPQDKRERRRQRQLHSPIVEDVASATGVEAGLLTPPIHSHPLEDESEERANLDSVREDPDPQHAWLAALEGEVCGEEMDGIALSPPAFAARDFDDFDELNDDALDLELNLYDDFDDGFGEPLGRRCLGADIITFDEDASDFDRVPAATAEPASIESPAPSFNEARSTFSRAVEDATAPLGSAAGLHRPRARSEDSSIIGFGEACPHASKAVFGSTSGRVVAVGKIARVVRRAGVGAGGSQLEHPCVYG